MMSSSLQRLCPPRPCRSLLIVLVLLCVFAFPQKAHAAQEVSTQLELRDWQLHPETSTRKYKITVPNTVIGALLEHGGKYDFDPFYGMNLKLINEDDFAVAWIFETTFDVSAADFAEIAKKSIRFIIHFHGINYRGFVLLNKKATELTNDTFVGTLRRFSLDVTALVHEGANTLSVQLYRPRPAGKSWRNPNPDLSISFFDWNPHPPDMNLGIHRPVFLETIRALESTSATPQPILVKFDGFVVKTELSTSASLNLATGASTSTARLTVSVVVKNWGANDLAPSDLAVHIDMHPLIPASTKQNHLLKSFDKTLKAGEERRMFFSWKRWPQLVVPNPPLWWPWEFGNSRPIFSATVGVALHAKPPYVVGDVTNYTSWNFALRTATRSLTRYGAFQLHINNVPMLVRAGGYAPDMFLRFNSSRLRVDFAMIRSMGLNAIRLEGMMMTTEFFDLADELGMMIIPGIGCCDGWQHWGIWPAENYDIAYASVVTQARRLGWHPSVVIFFASSDLLPPPNVESIYNNALRDEAWTNVVMSSAVGDPSSLTGPTGVKMTSAYSWEPPTYWLEDGSGLLNNGSMDFGGAFGFMTEGGPGESPMTLNSWKRTVPKEHLWSATDGSLDEWWNFHMGCPYSHFSNLSRYTKPLDARYGVSTSAETYLYRSQAANFEGIRSMFEGYSQHKKINATGVVQWQIKMAWPSNLWNLYDQYFVGHGGYYGAKRGCGYHALNAVMSYTTGQVFLINSRFQDMTYATHVQMTVLSLTGEVVATDYQVVPPIAGDAVVELDQLKVPLDGNTDATNASTTFFVKLQWMLVDNTYRTSINWYWLAPKMDVLGPWDGPTWWQTPCKSFANFKALNTLPPLADKLAVQIDPFNSNEYMLDDGAAFLRKTECDAETRFCKQGYSFEITLHNTRTDAVAFLVQLRLVDTASGDDVAPAFFSDNFFHLGRDEKRTIFVDAPLLETATAGDVSELPTLVHLEVESYNDVVANNNGPKKVTLGAAIAPPVPQTPVPHTLPTPEPGKNNTNADDKKNAAVAASTVAALVFGITTVIMLIVALRYWKMSTSFTKMETEQLTAIR